MRWPRVSIVESMAAVAIVAADFAALRAMSPTIPNPNPGMAAMVVVLEVGLFRVARRRGRSRAFWVGFEVAGWVYVLAHMAWCRPIWRRSRSLYEAYVLGVPITSSDQGFRFILSAGALQLALSTAFALLIGLACRAAATDKTPEERPCPDASPSPPA